MGDRLGRTRGGDADGGAELGDGAFPFKQLHAVGISLLHKNDSQDDLVAALRLVLGGGVVVSRSVQELLSASGRDPVSPIKLLGPKELRVLALLGQRLHNDEVAELLGCSVATVADHRKHIMAKLGCHHIEDLIDYAIRHGVVHAVTLPAPSVAVPTPFGGRVALGDGR